MNITTKRYNVLLIIMLLFVSLFKSDACSQDSIYNLIKGTKILNSNLSFNDEKGFQKIQLVDDRGGIAGYMIVQIDGIDLNTNYPESSNNNVISPKIFFIQRNIYEDKDGKLLIDSALVKIECDSCKIYEILKKLDLIYAGHYNYLKGKKDDLSVFLNYYQLFTSIPFISKGINDIENVSTIDILNNKEIWTKNDKNIGYIIFEVSFRAAIFRFENSKFFLPMSNLMFFKEVNEDILTKHGFKKTFKKIVVE